MNSYNCIKMSLYSILGSLVPSSLHRERKRSGQMCIEPVSFVQPRVRTNQIQVLRSNDVNNAINSYSSGIASYKSQ